jgi:FkbM family methyltransferase
LHLSVELSGERISKKFIKKFLPKFPTTIDCGAHTGDDSIEISKILGGKVYSFEPLPIIYEKLKNKIQNHSNIQCFPIALSNLNGKSKFYVSEGG